MIKPIHRVECSPALAACQRLMQHFAIWLCDLATTGTNISQQSLQPPVLPTSIEADWLWGFLQCNHVGRSLLSRAQTVADMPPTQKVALANWVQSVSALATQFQPSPTPWPIHCPISNASAWKAFKELMEAFYEKGFRAGLPYLSDGTPTNASGVNYAEYVKAFRDKHRMNPHPEAREICVMCGGPLGDKPHVDHWINKGATPLLSVCDNNLELICHTCNEAPNKGVKPVHSDGSFADWFHPYMRPGNVALQLNYVLSERSILCSSKTALDQPKAAKLDALLNLSSRWTVQFKAEYLKKLQEIANLKKRGRGPNDPAALTAWLEDYRDGLIDSEPYHEVHKALADAMLEPERVAAWQSELSLK